MNHDELIQKLIELDACKPALEWVKTTPGTSAELWAKCERGDWMWWILRQVKMPTKRQSVAFAKRNARVAKKYAAAAADAAYATYAAAAAAADADAAYAAYAADAAAYAAYAADAAADAADAAAYAAYAAYAAAAADADAYATAYAAAYAAADAAADAERKLQADYIRAHFECPL